MNPVTIGLAADLLFGLLDRVQETKELLQLTQSQGRDPTPAELAAIKTRIDALFAADDAARQRQLDEIAKG